MTKLYLLLLFIPLLNVHVFAQGNSYSEPTSFNAEFKLQITDIPELKGEIRIAIFDSEESYDKKKEPVHAIVLAADSNSITWSDEQLPYGEYAIAVYHDKNQNGELDTNILGIPKESYGFSNDARGKFGPASWNDAHFEVKSETVIHTISVK